MMPEIKVRNALKYNIMQCQISRHMSIEKHHDL